VLLLLGSSTIFINTINWRSSLSEIDFSQIRTRCVDILSLPIIMHITCWLIGDKVLYNFLKFPQSTTTMKVAITLTTLAIADIARRNVSNIKQDRYFKNMSPELKIVTAYTLATIGYNAATSLPIPQSLKYYNKYNLFQLTAGFLYTQAIPNFK